jgi:hypothetical protein
MQHPSRPDSYKPGPAIGVKVNPFDQPSPKDRHRSYGNRFAKPVGQSFSFFLRMLRRILQLRNHELGTVTIKGPRLLLHLLSTTRTPLGPSATWSISTQLFSLRLLIRRQPC